MLDLARAIADPSTPNWLRAVYAAALLAGAAGVLAGLFRRAARLRQRRAALDRATAEHGQDLEGLAGRVDALECGHAALAADVRGHAREIGFLRQVADQLLGTALRRRYLRVRSAQAPNDRQA